MKNRIIGIDVARALAIIGMIIVNFKVAFGDHGDVRLKSITALFDGKAAATFVVLAGVGLALMTNSAIKNNDKEKLKRTEFKIAKRAILLFLIGLSWIAIFPADILHYYGVFMLLTLLLLKRSNRTILGVAIALILVYPVLMIYLQYDKGWNFTDLSYHNFWELKSFMRNLLFNGFHPVMPWTSFMLFGYWFGRQDLSNGGFVKKTFMVSGIAFLFIQLFSYLLIAFLSAGDLVLASELKQILGTSPMPPLPIYMFNGISFAFMLISACILIATRIPNNVIIQSLMRTGQLALTFYIAHVVLGMGVVQSIDPSRMGSYSIEFSLVAAMIFSLLCIIFAVIWNRYYTSGPLEWVLRKLAS